MPAGQPTKYKVEYNEQARKLCLLGYTDEQLGDFFGVTERTINNWKEAHPEFFQSINNGKVIADAEVAEKLFEKAKGYSYVETSTVTGDKGKTITVHNKVAHPDTGAAFIWLKNRQSGKWRDKREVEAKIMAQEVTLDLGVTTPDEE